MLYDVFKGNENMSFCCFYCLLLTFNKFERNIQQINLVFLLINLNSRLQSSKPLKSRSTPAEMLFKRAHLEISDKSYHYVCGGDNFMTNLLKLHSAKMPLYFSKTSYVVAVSHRRCFVKKGVPKNFTNFTGKHLHWSLFLIKLQTISPVKFVKFLRTSILKNICVWLLL